MGEHSVKIGYGSGQNNAMGMKIIFPDLEKKKVRLWKTEPPHYLRYWNSLRQKFALPHILIFEKKSNAAIIDSTDLQQFCRNQLLSHMETRIVWRRGVHSTKM